ncbi:hypothetical protein BEWA_020100 [Theileria equi strain WA]|uniref:Uncharacterized protein n=1 Tax=Theileria equi strain WA TaxID=1537102 RepID=L0AW84_THEEQ|nr:hypothetical protein BEWA_020100 [Theileria equi strain WA]AFZ79164.1 hypothetical protein BEWA_020100 [Theileria equi strain WA]|eukprot:XP_004828830.1 hypothetical protein BEWA_020100 [Theileria equi strain WA]
MYIVNCGQRNRILRQILHFKAADIPSRNYGSSKLDLIRDVSATRLQWEHNKNQSDCNHTSDDYSDVNKPKYTVFQKNLTVKSITGTKYVAALQNVSKDTPEDKLLKLLSDISSDIDEFSPYELIDIGYYLTRLNRPSCPSVAEPIMHRFFSLPERYSCLNGVYIHRLLRTLFIYQDVTYRVWIYEVAKIIGVKHNHLSMRDLQLIIDDLSLFYDACAQSVLALFEKTVINRAHQLELYRLPLMAHALGRCCYNSINVAKAIHDVYLSKINDPDFYSRNLIGLLLKGYCSFHFHPGFKFLGKIWSDTKERFDVIEFKYLSWLMDSFLKLRYFTYAPLILEELIAKCDILSHLEYTDFIIGCWSIQSHFLALEFRPYIDKGTIWQEDMHKYQEKYLFEGVFPDDSDTFSNDYTPRDLEIDNSKETLENIYIYYKRLMSIIIKDMPIKIYKSTPPYRVTQFEVLTRLLAIYPNPRDFSFVLPLRKYDTTYPIAELLNKNTKIPEDNVDDIFIDFDHFALSKFFGPNHLNNDEIIDAFKAEGDSVEVVSGIAIKDSSLSASPPKLEPLNGLLKQYIHSFFFRTPAIAPRGLRLLVQGLIRIHFEQREDCVLDPDLLPSTKSQRYDRPLSCAILREVYRKLVCFNTDDLLVTLFCMITLRMFELPLAEEFLHQLTGMWTYFGKENTFLKGQLVMIALFYRTLSIKLPDLYSKLDQKSIKLIIDKA